MFMFLLNNKSLVISLILVSILVVGYGYICVLQSEKAALVAEKTTLTTQLTESQANLKQLQGDIQAQNAAINVLKAEADARAIKHAAEIKQAQDAASVYKKKAEDLLTSILPVNKPICSSADDLINQEIRNAHK